MSKIFIWNGYEGVEEFTAIENVLGVFLDGSENLEDVTYEVRGW